MLGVPAALVVASALYWFWHRAPSPPNAAGPSASSLQRTAPKEPAVKSK
jgi:hypothetical protein